MNAEQETRTMSFGIAGEFITQVAREWLYIEGKDIEKIMDLLMDSMRGTNTPEATIRRYAEDILIGRAALKGNTNDGTYHLERYDPDEEEKMPECMNIWKVITKGIQKQKQLQKDLDKMAERYAVAMEHVPYTEKKEVRRELGEEDPEDARSSMFENYLKRMMDEKEHKTEDYGWLAPDGTFHAVEWGEHQKWASDYMEEHMTEEDWLNDQTDVAGDYLTERGWVLLHNPSQGIAFPTKSETKPYTKAQKEFLYDYYMERDCKEESNAVWKEE